MLKLYNTLTRKIETLKEPDDKVIKIYTCGPTVYDYPHIGNWSSFIRWDLLVRLLRNTGYKTKWVMNITDVGHLTSDSDEGEDKLVKVAQKQHKSAWSVAENYTNYFLKGLELLNFSKPDLLPKATDNISDQINFIKKLEAEGLTYAIDDGVYFDTSKLTDYGKLSGKNLAKLKTSSRIQTNPQKLDDRDFALWKFSPKDKNRDMEWDSPWGKGFPGWHLECSALIKKFLGETIEIHGGGIDHIPVHHTNEIAQSESIHHKQLAKIWMHSNFIKVNGKKISKSLGNTINLEDIDKRKYSLEAFRLLVLESHYRSEAEFSWDTLSAAQNRLNHYYACACLVHQPISHINSYGRDFYDIEAIVEALQNDLNSPIALSIISEKLNKIYNELLPVKDVVHFKNLLCSIENITGIKLSSTKDIGSKQKELIDKRENARKNKDWVNADKYRESLNKENIEIRDTSYGPIWYRL